MAEGEQSVYRVVLHIDAGQEGLPEVTKAIQEMNGYVDRSNEKVGALSKAWNFLDKNVDRLGNTMKAFNNTMNSIGGFVGETLALGTAYDRVVKYSKEMIGLSSQFAKYGVGINQIEQSFVRLGKEISMTRAETMQLFSAYEKGFPMATLEGAERLFKNIQKVVGSNMEAIQEMSNMIGQLASQYPELQASLERMNDTDKERLKSQTNLLLLTGKISLQEAKRLQDYATGNKQLSAADELRLQKEKENVEVMQNIKKTFEEIALKMGPGVAKVMKEVADFLKDHETSIKNIAEFFGKWVAPLILVKGILGNVIGLGKTLLGAAGGIATSLGFGGKGSKGGPGGAGTIQISNFEAINKPVTSAIINSQNKIVSTLGIEGSRIAAAVKMSGAEGIATAKAVGKEEEAAIKQSASQGEGGLGGALEGGKKGGGKFGKIMGGIGKGAGYLAMAGGAFTLAKDMMGIEEKPEDKGKVSTMGYAAKGAEAGMAFGPAGAAIGALGGTITSLAAQVLGLDKEIEKAGGLMNYVGEGWQSISAAFWDTISGAADEFNERVADNAQKQEILVHKKLGLGHQAEEILKGANVDLSKEVKHGKNVDVTLGWSSQTQQKLMKDTYEQLLKEGKKVEAEKLRVVMEKMAGLSGESSKLGVAMADMGIKHYGKLAAGVGGFNAGEASSGAGLSSIEQMTAKFGKPKEKMVGEEEFKQIEDTYKQRKIMEGDITGAIKEKEEAEKNLKAAEEARDKALGPVYKNMQNQAKVMDENKDEWIKIHKAEFVKSGKNEEEAGQEATKRFGEEREEVGNKLIEIQKSNLSLTEAVNKATEKRDRAEQNVTSGLLNQKLLLEAQSKLSDSLASKLSATINYMAQVGSVNMAEVEKQASATIDNIEKNIKLTETQVSLSKRFLDASKKNTSNNEEMKNLAIQNIEAQLKTEKNAERINELEKMKVMLSDEHYNLTKESVAYGVLEATAQESIASGEAKIKSDKMKELEIRKSISNVYAGQLEKTQLEVQYANDLVGLYDSIGTGIGASSEMRMAAIGQMEEQRKVLQDQLEAMVKQYELAKKNGSTDEDQLGLLNQIKKTRNDMLSITKQEADMAKALRDGWISAIGAMTVGSGRISKIVMTSDQNTGMALQHLRGMVTSMKSGSLTGGYETSERFNVQGGITNAKYNAPYQTQTGGMLSADQGAMREAFNRKDFKELGNILTNAVQQGIIKSTSGGMQVQAYGAGGPGAQAFNEQSINNSALTKINQRQEELMKKQIQVEKELGNKEKLTQDQIIAKQNELIQISKEQKDIENKKLEETKKIIKENAVPSSSVQGTPVVPAAATPVPNTPTPPPSTAVAPAPGITNIAAPPTPAAGKTKGLTKAEEQANEEAMIASKKVMQAQDELNTIEEKDKIARQKIATYEKIIANLNLEAKAVSGTTKKEVDEKRSAIREKIKVWDDKIKEQKEVSDQYFSEQRSIQKNKEKSEEQLKIAQSKQLAAYQLAQVEQKKAETITTPAVAAPPAGGTSNNPAAPPAGRTAANPAAPPAGGTAANPAAPPAGGTAANPAAPPAGGTAANPAAPPDEKIASSNIAITANTVTVTSTNDKTKNNTSVIIDAISTIAGPILGAVINVASSKYGGTTPVANTPTPPTKTASSKEDKEQSESTKEKTESLKNQIATEQEKIDQIDKESKMIADKEKELEELKKTPPTVGAKIQIAEKENELFKMKDQSGYEKNKKEEYASNLAALKDELKKVNPNAAIEDKDKIKKPEEVKVTSAMIEAKKSEIAKMKEVIKGYNDQIQIQLSQKNPYNEASNTGDPEELKKLDQAKKQQKQVLAAAEKNLSEMEGKMGGTTGGGAAPAITGTSPAITLVLTLKDLEAIPELCNGVKKIFGDEWTKRMPNYKSA